MFDDEIRAGGGRSGVYSAWNIAQYSAISLYIFFRIALFADSYFKYSSSVGHGLWGCG